MLFWSHRYNMERLSNRLARVRRFVDLREPILEGYYPKLNSAVASRIWPARHPNSRLSVGIIETLMVKK